MASLHVNGIFPVPTQHSGTELLLVGLEKGKIFPNHSQASKQFRFGTAGPAGGQAHHNFLYLLARAGGIPELF